MEQQSELGLKVKLLGRFEIWRDGALISSETWKRRKTQILFKVLVSERGKIFTQDQLIEAVFPDLEPAKAARNLGGRVSELRRLLEPGLEKRDDSHYLLHPGPQKYCFSLESPCWVDTEEFEKNIQAAQEAEEAGRWPQALDGYQQATQLYQGDFLGDDLYEEWTLAPRERWHEMYLNALSRLAECHARLRQYAHAIECCQRAIQQQPSRESAYRQKMLYHYYASEQREALETYQACVLALKEHLNSEPTQETRELYEQILKREVPELPQVFPSNLPQPLTSFIGREREISKIKWLLNTTRLLTLTGAGGAGKTRLALQVAPEFLREFPDGVWLIEFASLSIPALVPQTVAAALGVREKPGHPPMDTLSDFLRTKKLLLVLDNCEHLVDACARLADELLRSCAGLQILATSREALGIDGETVWPVPPLSIPEVTTSAGTAGKLPPPKILKQYEAVGLFIERALASQPEFELTKQNASAVVQICQHLDGMPLAVELAAARVKALSPQQIAARLNDRFRLLTGGSRTAMPRHQTLQAAMDWSFDLLLDAERTFLRRLSVFVGGFTLEAAGQICTDHAPSVGARSPRPYNNESVVEQYEILELLTHLVDKSLVVAQPGEEVRYQLLETVRQYGREKLIEAGEESLLHQRHLEWFLALAEQAEPKLQESEQAEWLEHLEREHDNLRTALEWSLREEEKVEAGLRLAVALADFWRMRGYWSEGRQWLKEALPKSQRVPLDLRAKVLNVAGLLAWAQSDYAAARSFFEECLSIYRQSENTQGVAQALNNLGIVATDQGDYVFAHSVLEESLTICRELKLPHGMSYALNNLGNVADLQGSYSAARRYHEEGVAIHRELRDPWGLSLSLTNLGNTLSHDGDDATARHHYEEALALRREIGDRRGIAFTLSGLGNIALHQGDYATAGRLYAEGLSIRQKLGEKRGMAISLECFARLAIAQRQASRSVRLAGAADRLRTTIGAPRPPAERAEFALALQALRAAMANAEYAAAWAEGQAMTLEQAIEYALKPDKVSTS